MKLKITFFLIILSYNIFAQKVKLECTENIYYEENSNDLILFINNDEIKYSASIDSIFSSYKVTIICNKNNTLNLIYTFQNGNDYKIINNIFKKKNKNYFLDISCIEYLDRNQTSTNIVSIDEIEIEKFNINDIILDKKLIEKKVSLIKGYQEEKEVEVINYHELIKKYYKNKKNDDVLLFTNEFIIDKLNIIETISVNKLNNIAFYAYKSKAYLESIYILKKVIEKSPKRTVAYLNIADCYWETNKKEKAKENYKKYIELMKEQKKDLKKMPKSVYERIKK